MVNGPFVFPFEKLEVYRLALDLADYVFQLLESIQSNTFLRLIGQMEAAIGSIAQNIAEGKGRQYKKEFIQFLYIAEGSLFEALALSELFRRKKLFTDAEAAHIHKMSENVDRKLRGLINSLMERNK
jgi:four helix bundle protein